MFLMDVSQNLLLFLLILFVRISSIFLVKTAFVPDEFWQSLEVAHKISFGYGYLTWEWKEKIRSSFYPIIFHILYSISPETPNLIICLPRVFQAVLSTVGDFHTYKLASKLFGARCGQWTVFNILTSWFLFYCSSRTITNMAETSFTCCGLYYYAWEKGKQTRLSCAYLWFAGASVLMRPTAFVLWLPLYVYHIWREKDYFYAARNTLCIGSIVLSFLMVCDRWFYGQWVLTVYNFFHFNWTSDVGAFYGTHPFSWYFTVGGPVVLGIHCVPFCLGFFSPKLKFLYYLLIWVAFVFSILSHKEFRFLLPILPLALIICSSVMSDISSGRMTVFGFKVKKKVNLLIASAILIVNVPMSLYMGLFHQRGTVDVTLHLSEVVDHNSSVFFLMPCHSTPFYSHVHRNISMKFLTCEPNFENTKDYTDEADVFYKGPLQWLREKFRLVDSKELPSHLVMFSSLHSSVSPFLDKHKYTLCYRTFHSRFHDTRTASFVEIYCRIT